MRFVPFYAAAACLTAIILPATAQVLVDDPRSFAQLVQQVTTAGSQLTQLESQYTQALQNAKAMASLQTLMNAYGVSPTQLSQSQMKNLLSNVYTLSSNDPNWSTNLSNTLAAQGYTVPQTTATAQGNAAGVYDANYAATYNANYAKTTRDFNDYSGSSQLMADVQNQLATTSTNLNDKQIPAVSALSDNSMGASLHTLAAGQVLQSQQQDATNRLQTIQAHAALQSQLKQVENATTSANETLSIDKGRQQFLSGTITDTTTNPVTQ